MNKTMLKKVLAGLLVLCMVLPMLPTVNLEAATVVVSGTSGNITWSLDSDGCLTITGNGTDMPDYFWGGNVAPWCLKSEYREFITSCVLKNVASVGEFAFWDCCNLKN